MNGINRVIRRHRLGHATAVLHQVMQGSRGRDNGRQVRLIEHPAQAILDQILQHASTQSCLRLGTAKQIVGKVNSGAHKRIKA
jgi:hypothetical protein